MDKRSASHQRYVKLLQSGVDVIIVKFNEFICFDIGSKLYRKNLPHIHAQRLITGAKRFDSAGKNAGFNSPPL